VLGSTYRYRVRAIDRAGNVGAWYYTPLFRAAAYDDSSTAMRWSAGWTVEALGGALRGKLHLATASGATVSFRLSGRSVAWLAPRGPDGGFAQVWVDGILTSTISLTATSARPSMTVWRTSWTSLRTHTVRIQVLGTMGRPKVGIDAFVVLR
jgi:hypothetical protein